MQTSPAQAIKRDIQHKAAKYLHIYYKFIKEEDLPYVLRKHT